MRLGLRAYGEYVEGTPTLVMEVGSMRGGAGEKESPDPGGVAVRFGVSSSQMIKWRS